MPLNKATVKRASLLLLLVFLVITITYPGTASSIFSYKDADFKGSEKSYPGPLQEQVKKLLSSYWSDSKLQTVSQPQLWASVCSQGVSVFILKEKDRNTFHLLTLITNLRSCAQQTLRSGGFSEENNCSAWGEMEEGVSKMFSFHSHTQTQNGSKGSKAIGWRCHTPPAVRLCVITAGAKFLSFGAAAAWGRQ